MERPAPFGMGGRHRAKSPGPPQQEILAADAPRQTQECRNHSRGPRTCRLHLGHHEPPNASHQRGQRLTLMRLLTTNTSSVRPRRAMTCSTTPVIRVPAMWRSSAHERFVEHVRSTILDCGKPRRSTVLSALRPSPGVIHVSQSDMSSNTLPSSLSSAMPGGPEPPKKTNKPSLGDPALTNHRSISAAFGEARFLGRSEVCRWGDDGEETLSGQGDLDIVGPVVHFAKSSGIEIPRTQLECRCDCRGSVAESRAPATTIRRDA